jgi:glucoamylase
MLRILEAKPAWGWPGIEPKWTRSDKDGIGTAYSAISRVWFTISKGILNEIYYPRIDRPQIRDLQYLVSDGKSFFFDERQLDSVHEPLARHTLGYRITNSDPEGRFRIIKEVISDPHQDCVLQKTRLEADADLLSNLRLYTLLAPHLEVGGWHNSGNVVETNWGRFLAANKDGAWVLMAASIPFLRCSCGYVGFTDGWRDLLENFQMDWEFDSAPDGNIALMAELDWRQSPEFVLSLSFGDSLHKAFVVAQQALGVPFDDHRQRFIEQWKRSINSERPAVDQAAGDGGHLFRASCSLLFGHEDKIYDGAMIASLSIPWGEYMSDDDLGGYHLVWTRDMCNSATALLAAGSRSTPLRALIYLASTNCPEGGFAQNFWIEGEPYWRGMQLDETAFPIILAWRLMDANALKNFDPYPMVERAAGFLISKGPASQQERWEENSGYSPSTLAAHIAGLVCAADFAWRKGQTAAAQYLEEYADFLESHVDRWTVTTQGTLLSGVPRHFIRIHPVDINDSEPDEDPNHGTLDLRNQPPGSPVQYPAKEIVDAGFLQLVRYGIRKPGEALFEDSLRVVDHVLRVETPAGPCFRRYNHDGYGQRIDGGPFLGWGKGHAWPLLTGERGHYELAAGRDPEPYLRAMEGFATSIFLLPEQIWSEQDLPHARMFFGKPTSAALPLMWAHAEYVRLLRSKVDGQVFDLIRPVAERYLGSRPRKAFEIWKLNRRPRSVRPGETLRIQADAAFRLRWTKDEWQKVNDSESGPTGLGPHFTDIPVGLEQSAPIKFTFYWTDANRWEGIDYTVLVLKNRG